MPGLRGDGTLEHPLGLGVAAALGQQPAIGVEHVAVVRRQVGGGGKVALGRAAVVLVLVVEVAQDQVGPGVAWVELEHADQVLLGGGGLAQLHLDHGQLAAGLGVLGQEPERLLVEGGGLPVAAAAPGLGRLPDLVERAARHACLRVGQLDHRHALLDADLDQGTPEAVELLDALDRLFRRQGGEVDGVVGVGQDGFERDEICRHRLGSVLAYLQEWAGRGRRLVAGVTRRWAGLISGAALSSGASPVQL